MILITLQSCLKNCLGRTTFRSLAVVAAVCALLANPMAIDSVLAQDTSNTQDAPTQGSDKTDSATDASTSVAEIKSSEADKAVEGQLALQELRSFVTALSHIRKAYVEEVDDKTLLQNAIKGMLTELDPHSNYLEPQSFEDLQVSATGAFGGLGLEVGMEDGFVKGDCTH